MISATRIGNPIASKTKPTNPTKMELIVSVELAIKKPIETEMSKTPRPAIISEDCARLQLQCLKVAGGTL